MFVRTALALSMGLLLAHPAWPRDCPVEGSFDLREQAIRKAPTCRAAYEIMQACAYGAGGDTGLGAAVHERCEPEFLPGLSKRQRRTYDHEQKRCDQKYGRESGTMYRSFTAFCQAKSTVAHAAKYGQTGRK